MPDLDTGHPNMCVASVQVLRKAGHDIGAAAEELTLMEAEHAGQLKVVTAVRKAAKQPTVRWGTGYWAGFADAWGFRLVWFELAGDGQTSQSSRRGSEVPGVCAPPLSSDTRRYFACGSLLFGRAW